MEKLNLILIKVLKIKENQLVDELTMEDVVLWDSLKHMELITSIENELGIELSAEDIMEMVNIKAIRTIVGKYKA